MRGYDATSEVLADWFSRVANRKVVTATKEHLNHNRPETTMKYDGAPSEDRRDALDRMG